MCDDEESVFDKVESYLKGILCEDNRFSQLNMKFKYRYFKTWDLTEKKKRRKRGKGNTNLFRVGRWLEKVICLVPIQIARHDFGEFRPLCNGETIILDDQFDNQNEEVEMKINDYRNRICYGLYDTILRSKDVNVYVISCAGKQSTGKSTLLNNMTGTFFNTGLDRCTIGIWMSMKCVDDAVYLVLDFEGLGTLQNDAHEDMLSSLFGAGLSSLFVIRTELSFDEWTENTFKLWATGARKLKNEQGSLFRGKLVVNPRDVIHNSGFESAIAEYFVQFRDSLEKNVQDVNKTRRREGKRGDIMGLFQEMKLQATPSPISKNYLGNVWRIMDLVDQDSALFDTGALFLEKSKLFMAQLSLGSFWNVDDTYLGALLEDTKKDADDAIYGGATSDVVIEKVDEDEFLLWRSRSRELKEQYGGSAMIPDYPEGQRKRKEGELELSVCLKSEEVECFRKYFVKLSNNENVWVQISEETQRERHLVGESRKIVKGVVKISGIPDAGLILGPVTGLGELFNRDPTEFWVKLSLHMRRMFIRFLPVELLSKTVADLYHRFFKSFLFELKSRRADRARKWVENRLGGQTQFKAEKKVLESKIRNLESTWLVCDTECQKCYFKCTNLYSHPREHDCGFDHRCLNNCEICLEENNTEIRCSEKSGHPKPVNHKVSCVCNVEKHLCGLPCDIKKRFPDCAGCLGKCREKVKHEGEHRCSPDEKHLCGEICSLDGCSLPCNYSVLQNHDRHKCDQEKLGLGCRENCPLCGKTCQSENHFHAVDSPGEEHFCGEKHQCKNDCSHDGVCHVEMSVKFKKDKSEITSISGDKIRYYTTVKCNGTKKKKCVKFIPKDRMEHEGDCQCFQEGEESEHSCTETCLACGYFCHLPYGHEDLHETNHGSMKNVKLVVGKEVDNFEFKVHGGQIGSFRSGLRGDVTRCADCCKNLGRGHVHLVECRFEDPEKCEKSKKAKQDDKYVRHQTKEYKIDDTKKVFDEVKCRHYWKEVLKFDSGFIEEEEEKFNKCSYMCGSCEHNDQNGGGREEVFCVLPLMHSKMKEGDDFPPGYSEGFISSNGCFFPCTHRRSKIVHSYLILDVSGSMHEKDIHPQKYDWIKNKRNDRLGCVLESCVKYVETRVEMSPRDRVSMVDFDNSAGVKFENMQVGENLMKNLCENENFEFNAKGGTMMVTGLVEAEELLKKYNQVNHQAVFILFSDGEDFGESKAKMLEEDGGYINNLCKRFEDLVVHTVVFKAGEETMEYMKRVANAGGGKCFVTECQLDVVQAFEAIAKEPAAPAITLLS